MTSTQQIPTRAQVKTEETWDLTDLFRDFQHWEQEFNNLPTEDALEQTLTDKYKNKLHNSAQLLFECLQYQDALVRKLNNLYVYSGLRNAENVADNASNVAMGKIENKSSSLMAKFSFLEPEILSIEHLGDWINSAPLDTYAYRLNELIRNKPHVLSEKEEELLTRISTAFKTFDDIHSKWNNVDLQFSAAADSSGQQHLVTNARYGVNLQSQDRVLRENTFNSYYKEVSKWRNTITSNYYGNMLSGSLLAKVRKFSGALAAELFSDNIPTSLYDNLIATVRKNLHLSHRSMHLRKKLLKIEAVFPYDRAVSLYNGNGNTHFSWEEGRDLVLAALAPMGEEYVSIATKGLTIDRWIDRAENEGKRSGAFSWGTHDSRPYMLQTWTGTLNDVYTLAHELGHSMHSYYSHKNQPYHKSSYTIFVAEVASTLNEALLTHHILNNSASEELKKYVISKSIENFEGTVLRQVLFATFEKEAAQIADQEECFTPDQLEEIYYNLNTEWYGAAATSPAFVRHEWMRIPHFYTAFYVYKYATSYCASLALAENLFNNPASRENIFNLLKAGGSKEPLAILKDAGVDFLTPTPIENAFANYQRNIEHAEKVLV